MMSKKLPLLSISKIHKNLLHLRGPIVCLHFSFDHKVTTRINHKSKWQLLTPPNSSRTLKPSGLWVKASLLRMNQQAPSVKDLLVYLCIYIYFYIQTHVFGYKNVYTYIRTNIYMHTYTYGYISSYECKYVHMNIYICMYLYSYTCIHLGIGAENTEENRRKYRQLLFKTKGNDFRSPDCFSLTWCILFNWSFLSQYICISICLYNQVHIYVLKESDANTANYV